MTSFNLSQHSHNTSFAAHLRQSETKAKLPFFMTVIPHKVHVIDHRLDGRGNDSEGEMLIVPKAKKKLFIESESQ